MTAKSILQEIKPLGKDSYKKVLFSHGVKEPCFGVKIEDLKVIQKRINMDYRLALDLYDTGNYDAMYLAGLIADDAQMTRKDLERWIDKAYCAPLVGSTVPWVAAGSQFGYELALEWIEAGKGLIAAAGWATLSCLVSTRDDSELDLARLEELLARVEQKIHHAPDVVRFHMNAFVIAVGAYVSSLTSLALRAAENIGPVKANLGDTDCRVPFAPDSIRKFEKRGTIGKKRERSKC